jgi:hypothetical protein
MQPGSWLRMNGPTSPVRMGTGEACAGSSEEEQCSYKAQVEISKFSPRTGPLCITFSCWLLLSRSNPVEVCILSVLRASKGPTLSLGRFSIHPNAWITSVWLTERIQSPIAQTAEHRTVNAMVIGSSPVGGAVSMHSSQHAVESRESLMLVR